MNIKIARERARLTQAQVAARVGANRSTVAHWEAGDTAPRTADLPRLAAVLGVTVDELLREPDAAPGAASDICPAGR